MDFVQPYLAADPFDLNVHVRHMYECVGQLRTLHFVRTSTCIFAYIQVNHGC
jgi:hypothetical protein